VSLVGVLATSAGRDQARWRLGALVGAGAAVAIAAGASQVLHGTIWDRPFSDLVWWFDALMLIETIVALVLAVVLATPGCELGVWPVLINRARREPAPSGVVGCIIGLHLVDDWEASRRHAPH
jgi:hypothetical protein